MMAADDSSAEAESDRQRIGQIALVNATATCNPPHLGVGVALQHPQRNRYQVSLIRKPSPRLTERSTRQVVLHEAGYLATVAKQLLEMRGA